MSFSYDYSEAQAQQQQQQQSQPQAADISVSNSGEPKVEPSSVTTDASAAGTAGSASSATTTGAAGSVGLDANGAGSVVPPGTSTSPALVAGSPPTASSDSKSTLWMGELEPWYDENAIGKIWQNFGENVTVKLIRDKYSGVNAGYCFVDFGTPQAAAKALSLNGQPIPNSQRVFRLNWASGGGLIDKRDDRGPEFSIFVGDLSPEVTEFNLLQLFQSRYSSCKSAKIMTDPSTNASRGYGFVRFNDETHMQRALAEMQGFFLGNRPIRISTATPKSKPGQNGLVGNSGNGAGPNVGGPGGLYHQMGMGGPPPPAGYYGTPQTLNQFTDPNNTTVFVGGLSGHVTEDELRRYFAGFGDITYVRIPPGKGCGFVQFVQRHSAEAAITQMQGYPIGSSRVRLSWGRSQNAVANAGLNGLPGGPGGNNGPPPGAYRPAPPPPNVYPQLNIPAQPHYGPYGPINPHVQGQVDIHGQQQQQLGGPIPGVAGAAGAAGPVPGVAQVNNGADPLLPLGQDPSEPVPVARLNELYLAARDGRLDRMDADGRGYHGVYAQ
ncbi:Nam8p [Sugiyamaella lignohabitans]|uniref:Nam8p n=1 Tax=Sugiyamaella lignohabitans TaxID=796027 RepID=A0A161HFM9_9ASCO|nr:Nam8p [Sugiyamaella lignohabitans]ANB14380.1 Nam8p [Sugiyamaella lignohabitans]